MIKIKGVTWPDDIFKNFRIERLASTSGQPRVQAFVKKLHYSKSLARGCNNVFVLWSGDLIYGVAMFGSPVSRNAQMYSSGQGAVIECKRFVLARKAPKNVASWFLAKCIREIKKDRTIDTILSYADSERGHRGIIYRAANFKYEGKQKYKGQVIMMEGKKIHLRAAYQKFNGKPTKTATQVQEALKTGVAVYKSLKPKHIYTYNLKK